MSEGSLNPSVMLIAVVLLALIVFVIRPAMRARSARRTNHPRSHEVTADASVLFASRRQTGSDQSRDPAKENARDNESSAGSDGGSGDGGGD